MRTGALAAVLAFATPHLAAEQAATLARDIQPSVPSFPDVSVSALATVGDVAYFIGPSYTGTVLWRSDGPAGGTHPLRNVDWRSLALGVYSLTGAGGRLFFAASGPAVGQELWSSDGTEAGTSVAGDVCPGPCSGLDETSFRRTLAAAGGLVFFSARDGVTGQELWRSDGTAAGTVLVKDVEPNGSSVPQSATRWGARLLFTADDQAHGRELWVTDGTAAGTVLLADARPGPADGVGSQPRITPAGTRAFFVANDGVNGAEPWVVDGASARLLADVRPGADGSAPKAMTAIGDVAIFQAEMPTGSELWRSDGTPSGTFRLMDLGYQGEPFATPFAVAGGAVLFMAGDAAHGLELWRTDGTLAGTSLVADIAPGPDSSVPAQLTRLGGRAFFTADDGTSGEELWVTDGTADGTRRVADPMPGGGQSRPRFLTPGVHLLYFLADTSEGRRLFRTDGTEDGTLALPVRSDSFGSNPEGFVPFGGQAFFTASRDGSVGLWRSDGTEPGTQLVKELGASADVALYLAHGGRLLFTLTDLAHGRELWSSDGTEAGTQIVIDLLPGANGSQPHDLTSFAGAVYFGASAGLYRTDGTAAGTQLVSREPADRLKVHQGTLFFATATSLWKSDGTTAGTVPVKEINPLNAAIRELISVGPRLFFIADDGVHGSELWTSDGSGAGTSMVRNIQAGSGSAFDVVDPSFVDWNGVLYFIRGHGGGGGMALWRSDGTEAGTVEVQVLAPALPAAASMAVANGALHYFASDPSHGLELWRRDTPDTASMVADLWPGPGGSEPGGLYAVDETVFFTAKSPTAGWELFRSDGTAAGTGPIDIEPGSASAVPWGYRRVGDRLFMSATDLPHGREPWSLRLGRAVSIADASVAESNGTTAAQIAVTLSSPSLSPVTVAYATGGGNASPGLDYTPAAGTVTFAPGVSSVTLQVAVAGDALDEDTETFDVVLDSTEVLVGDGQGRVHILDDDPLPSLALSDCATLEGQSGTSPCAFAVQLSAPSGRGVSAGFATGAGSASSPGDFLGASGTVAFAPGETSRSIAVDVAGDVLHEGNEWFRVDLDGPQNATPADEAGIGSILDDDGSSSPRGELAHGTSDALRLGASGTNDFRFGQAPFASFEVLLDAVSGADAPLALRRLAADGAVVQSSQPIGTGAAVRLAWENGEGVGNDAQLVRTAAACAPACAGDVAYRVRAYDTTYAIPRFNNAGGQVTVLLLQNRGAGSVTGHVRFWHASGQLLATSPFTLPPHGSLVLNAAGLPELAGAAGSITVTSDAGYGALSGKAAAIEPGTGLTFDAPLLARPR